MDIKIDVRHTSIVINNYDIGDCPTLENFFKIFDPVRFVTESKGIVYNKDTKQLFIPRGLDIYYVEKLIGSSAIANYSHDPIGKVDKVMIKYLPRDDKQKEAIRFILGEGEYKRNKNKSQLSVNLNTGAGKTYVAIMSAAFLEIKSILITSSINWLEQWKKCISEYTDILPSEIYMITGTPSILNLVNGRKDITKYKFFLASHSTIKSYGDSYGWDKVGELFKLLKIGMKMYDEAHLSFDNMCMIDYHTNTYKTLYLTATPARSDRKENNIFKLYFKNIPSIDLFDEDEDPRTKYIAIRFNSLPTPVQISSCKNQYGLNRNGYIDYIVNNDRFYDVVRIVLDIVRKVDGKILFYIGTNNGITTVVEWIKENYPEYEEHIGIFTSIVKENKEDALNKRFIFSTTKSCGAAVDIKDLKCTVVLAEPFKSEVLARQTLGRTRERNTKYIDIVDDGFLHLKKFYQFKKPIFNKYASNCTEVFINNKELNERSLKLLNDRPKNGLRKVIEFID